MNRIHLSRQKMIFACAIAFASLGFTNYPTRVQAQTSQPVTSTNFVISVSSVNKEVNFTPPSRGRPTQRKSTGRRDSCSNSIPLIALVPLTQEPLNQSLQSTSTNNQELGLGVTGEKYPTFWFYVPELPPNIRSAEFMLRDENKEDVFSKPISITLSGTPGIISFRLPSTEKPLELDKLYYWSFSIVCNPQIPSEASSVNGWVQRVPLNSSLSEQLEESTEKKRLELYAENGFWHETVTLLAKQRCAVPKDATLAADWVSLLQDVGLGEIADKPIVQCHILEK